ncbi:DUF2254 domain-containing protein [uncultured Roseobacter sp.]|uniref:DUF2254 domain-containing protein n=1 Tax=uncultured Roseobacter sp. TaxID=114847 RepID=UPI0026292DDA|nr:DUF2254 domain-containing protein [uncultured Roseobacter sp.]
MSKRALLAKIIQDIRASYWFLPTILVLLAIVLVQVTLRIDYSAQLLPDEWRTTQVAGARAVLSVIAAAVIGVAGVMFSLTIVAVSFASGNFGPRLIGNFMQDRGNQWSLGILIATFVYALLTLRAVQSPFGSEPSEAFVPHFSMLVAFGLTGVSILTMIYFVHHIPEIINVSNISHTLGRRLRDAITALIDGQPEDAPDSQVEAPANAQSDGICLAGDGYIQTWNLGRLTRLAGDNDLVVEVCHEAGSFVSRFTPVLRVQSDGGIGDDLRQELRDCFAIGPKPTETQNLLFVARQLSEMVARALSPGVNDPFTAINCLNWMYVGLGAAACHGEGLKHRPRGRVLYPTVTFDDLLEATFANSLPYIRTDSLVMKHLERLLERLISETGNDDARASLEAFASEVAETGG